MLNNKLKNKYISSDNRDLHDNRILQDLKKAVSMYENGELIEVSHILFDISMAIISWEGPI